MLRISRATWTAALVFVLLAVNPGQALGANGPYTRPFFNASVGVTQPYGCTSYDNEPIWSGTNADDDEYPCSGSTKYFHKGIDFSTGSTKSIAASAAGQVVTVYNEQDISTCGTKSTGNHVIIMHDSTHYSMYYHVAKDSILVDEDDFVSAGQKIATSGNTGNSCGAHLHYVLMKKNAGFPDAKDTYAPNGKWTTSPGRVPWLANYDSQSGGGTSLTGSVDVCNGVTVTHWVKFENVGGRTWSSTNDQWARGRVLLYSTNAAGDATVNSQFQAADWEDSFRVTPADQSSVAPDAKGTFTFGVKGFGVSGTYYVNHFTLRAYDLRWFDYDELGTYKLTVLIVPTQAC